MTKNKHPVIDSTPTNKPLANDPAREAVDSMRGYNYQILRSVLTWLQLRDNETLYLEGAEDIDRVYGSEAIVEQVKDTVGSGNVTLRSKSAIEAIGNYWNHRQRNPGRRVTFRYLTTSNCGYEQGSPFGGKAGIDFWNQVRSETDAAAQLIAVKKLRSFVRSLSGLPTTLTGYLDTASDSDVLVELIQPISWYVGVGQSEDVASQIEEILVIHGNRLSIPSPDSERVLSTLHRTAWTVATREKDRSLTKADFIRAFDEDTQVSIPKAQLSEILGRLALGASSEPTPNAIVGARYVIEPPPPLPPRYHHRKNLLAAIREATKEQIVVVQGATGTGKTISVAALAIASEQTWGWVDLRGLSDEPLRDKLLEVENIARTSDQPLPIVLDDLDVGGDPRSSERSLAILAKTQNERGAPLVITTAQDLSSRLCLAIGFLPEKTLRMPAFTREEIESFLHERACPDAICRAWSILVEVATLGHPQLVHARVAALEASKFPDPKTADLSTTPRDVSDIRLEARRLVSELDGRQRELLYRSSLMIGTFNRKRLLAVANIKTAIPEPGHYVDALVGPWLEVVTPDLYRISPLIQSAGAEVNGPQWAESMHRAIAIAILKEKTLTPQDVSAVMMHSLFAKADDAFVALGRGVIGSARDVWRSLAETAFWFPHVATEPGVSLPFATDGARFMARLMQYKIAATRQDYTTARSIIDRFNEEFPSTKTELPYPLMRFMFLSQILIGGAIGFSMQEVIKYTSELVHLSAQIPDVREIMHKQRKVGQESLVTGKSWGIGDVANVIIHLRLKTLEDLVSFVDALEGMPDGEARLVLESFGLDESVAKLGLDRIWLAEFNQPQPNWRSVSDVLERILELGLRLSTPMVARAAARILVRVADENLTDPAGALALCGRFSEIFGDHPTLLDARARVLARRGDLPEAVALWRAALPRWTEDGIDYDAVNAFREAGTAAARLGDWPEAAEFWTAGSDRRIDPGRAALRAGLRVDAGFAHWKAGNSRAAAENFGVGVGILEELQEQSDDDLTFTVQKRVGHTLMWVSSITSNGKDPSGYAEPPPGCCSSLERIPPGAVEETPLDYIIGHLVEFAETTDARVDFYARYHELLRSSSYVLVRFTHGHIAIQRCFRRLQFDDLVNVYVDTAEAGILAKQKDAGVSAIVGAADVIRTEETKKAIAQFCEGGMRGALYSLAARGDVQGVPIALWVKAANGRGIVDLLSGFFTDVQNIIVGPGAENPWAIVSSTEVSANQQNLASLILALRNDTSPLQMIVCHGTWAYHFKDDGVRLLISSDVETLVVRAWTTLSDRAFLLVTPTVTVPAIKAAIASSDVGWSKVKKIGLAALDAVPSSRISSFVRGVLERLE